VIWDIGYQAAFPEQVEARATSAIGSLAPFGFPDALIEAWAGSIPSLNQLQLDAINEYGVLSGEHPIAVAPTSSGKTMIGELAALKAVGRRQRAIFLLPLKALVADKRRHFEGVYGAYGLRTIEATGETDDISPLLRAQYDVALLTYEKFASIALTHPHVLEQAGVVVVDEVQMNRRPYARRKSGIPPNGHPYAQARGNRTSACRSLRRDWPNQWS
jgi:ATP-dependent DNA helicase